MYLCLVAAFGKSLNDIRDTLVATANRLTADELFQIGCINYPTDGSVLSDKAKQIVKSSYIKNLSKLEMGSNSEMELMHLAMLGRVSFVIFDTSNNRVNRVPSNPIDPFEGQNSSIVVLHHCHFGGDVSKPNNHWELVHCPTGRPMWSLGHVLELRDVIMKTCNELSPSLRRKF